MEKVGFIGLGTIGRQMAKRLLTMGCDLTVRDIKKEAQDELIEMGAKGAASAREVAETCKLIITMVMDDATTEEVIVGKDGIITGMAPGTLIVIMSTVSPSVCQRMASVVSEKGGSVIDAPVTRGQGAPDVGTLTIMVGGSEPDFDRCLPVLQILGKRVFHLGPVGNGAVAKLFNNLVLVITQAATLEAFTLAKAAGIGIKRAREIMMVGSGYTQALEMMSRNITGGKLKVAGGGLIRMGIKDIALAAQAGDSFGVDLSLARCCTTIDFAKELDELNS